MELLVIRHGIAEDRDAFAASGKDDALRPLTDEGRRKLRQVARGLTILVPALDVLASSPLVRARQTADLVAKAYSGLSVTDIISLEPDQPPDAFAEWARGQSRRGAVAAVGHEPLLGRIVSLLLAGRGQSFIELKKGGACLVGFPDRVEPGAGVLRWLLTPGQLRGVRG
ncbi:MAG: histidine phosphatase family protein [Gemmatimonadetes bacterium]|nr:histidine phosphatase family protein [Gemmatimonadota bacterium]MBI2616061.1 histidine phosphatase family protein [Gemmatimonadota bacterium]